jgi:ribosomal protein L31E
MITKMIKDKVWQVQFSLYSNIPSKLKVHISKLELEKKGMTVEMMGENLLELVAVGNNN